MSPTGITFIDGLRKELSAGSITRDDALDRLLPWEDDIATRTQDELEAAWTLRQELETGTSDNFEAKGPANTNGTGNANGAMPPTTASLPRGADTETERMIADLRANPFVTRDDLLAANAICTRLAPLAAAASDSSTGALCAEVEERVARYVETRYGAIDNASAVLQDTPGMEEKLAACNDIREGLADIDALRPGDPTLPDMIAWCEQSRQELIALLAERDLVHDDMEGLSRSDAMDTGLVESSKQHLITLSDMQLSKDDIGFRKIARRLAALLTLYLTNRLQPGTKPDRDMISEYERVLHLAKQAPEAIKADEAKKYADKLALALAESEHVKQASEPPAVAPPPPPEPRSTPSSQPRTESLRDGIQSQPNSAAASTHAPAPGTEPGYRQAMPPPPPPRVQPGWGSTSTQPTPPAQGYGTTGQGHASQSMGGATGTGIASVPPTQYNTTISTAVNPAPFPQPAPLYGPPMLRQGLPPAAWAGIAAGVALILLFLVVLIAVLAGQGKPSVSTNPVNGGGAGSRDVALSFYQNLQAHNYQAAYDLLGPPLSTQTDVNTLRGSIVALENREGSMQTIDVSNASESGDTAQATVTVGYAKGNRSIDQVALSKQSNRWLITNIVGQQ